MKLRQEWWRWCSEQGNKVINHTAHILLPDGRKRQFANLYGLSRWMLGAFTCQRIHIGAMSRHYPSYFWALNSRLWGISGFLFYVWTSGALEFIAQVVVAKLNMGMTTNQRNLDQWFHISNKSDERWKHAPVEYDLLAWYVRLWLQYCLIPPVGEK